MGDTYNLLRLNDSRTDKDLCYQPPINSSLRCHCWIDYREVFLKTLGMCHHAVRW